MLRVVGALLICICTSLAGCVSGRLSMSADPLEKVCAGADKTGCAQGATNLDQVHDLVQDSQTKCQAYITNLFAGVAGTNTSLDIIGTAFSAAATVFKPLTTVHALSAGSTLASGSKTSIQTEYMNSVTINHVIQAIQSTYGVRMQAYITYLGTVDNPNGIDVVAERSTIMSYHALCSLAAANGTIGSSLQPPAAQKSPPQLSTTYKVKSADTTPESIAKAIADQITRDAAFSNAGIKADASGDTVTLTVPDSLTATWRHSQFSSAPGKATATESAEFQDGPPLKIKISGTGQENDALTIESASLTVSQAAAPTTPPTQQPAAQLTSTKLTLSYSVSGAEKDAVELASKVLAKINSDPKFHAAGVTAAESAGGANGTLTVSVKNGAKLVWGSISFKAVAGGDAKETVTSAAGPPPTLKFGGTPQKDDKLTVEATVTTASAARVSQASAPPPQFSPRLPQSGRKPLPAIPGDSVAHQ